MIAFFFTMPISMMMPINPMTFNSLPVISKRENGAHSGGGQG